MGTRVGRVVINSFFALKKWKIDSTSYGRDIGQLTVLMDKDTSRVDSSTTPKRFVFRLALVV
jgi:hypothetical protein